MKNKLTDLNNHLFAQLERLSDESTTGTALVEEIDRSKAVTAIANAIIGNGKLVLDGTKAVSDRLINNPPEMLGITRDE